MIILVYNTYNNQDGTYHVTEGHPPSASTKPFWTLRLEGYLENPSGTQPRGPPTEKFTSFFKRIVIQLDEEEYKEDSFIEWISNSASPHTDGFQISRKGSKDTTAKILLVRISLLSFWKRFTVKKYLDQYPPKYTLSAPLARMFNLNTSTKPNLMLLIWFYLKSKKLLDAQARKITCNETLKEIFECDSMELSELPEYLSKQLSPPEPVEINYTIRITGNPKEALQAFKLNIEDFNESQGMVKPYEKEITELDMKVRPLSTLILGNNILILKKKIAEAVKKINEKKRKRDFYQSFCLDPSKTLNLVLASKNNDERSKALLQKEEEVEERKSEFYYHPYLNNAVEKYFIQMKAEKRQK